MADVTDTNTGEEDSTSDVPVIDTGSEDGLFSGPTVVEPVPEDYNDPLKNLPQNRVRNLRYPLEVSNNHYVKFFINLDDESSLIKKNYVQVTGDAPNVDQNRLNNNNASAEAISTMGGAAGAVKGVQMGASVAKKIFKSNPGKYSSRGAAYAGVIGATIGGLGGASIASLGVEEFKLTKRLKRLAASVTLYTPAAISSTYGVNYEQTEDLLVQLAQSHRYESINEGLKMSNAGSIASGVSRIIAASASSTVSILSRTAKNPKKDMLFRSVDNRSFIFDYQFAPRNAKEAREVADIIFMFKFFAHPELLEGYQEFLYIYPAEFDIMYGMIDENGTDRENLNLNKISSCVLETVSVNYASNGSFQSLQNGEPIITNLSLRFKEIETLHQGRIAKGY